LLPSKIILEFVLVILDIIWVSMQHKCTKSCHFITNKQCNIYLSSDVLYSKTVPPVVYWSYNPCNVGKNTGSFIMFSVITNIYNNNNCSEPQKNWKSFFWQLEMFGVYTTGDTAHIDAIFKF
jgi:hypothetical protein